MEKEKITTNFEGEDVVAVKQDGYCIYARLLKQEGHGVWLRTKTKTLFVTYSNLKEIYLNERAGEF